MINRRVLGVVALFLAAGLAVGGTFLPLWRLTSVGIGGLFELDFAATPWGSTEGRVLGLPGLTSPLFGVPMVAAAALLVLAAVLMFHSSRVSAVARLVALGAAALLTGAVASALLWAENELDRFDPSGGMDSGAWVLTIACAAAMVGALLVQELPSGLRRPAGPVAHRVEDRTPGDDTATPPFGLPAPSAPHTARPCHPTGGQPSTGEPPLG